MAVKVGQISIAAKSEIFVRARAFESAAAELGASVESRLGLDHPRVQRFSTELTELMKTWIEKVGSTHQILKKKWRKKIQQFRQKSSSNFVPYLMDQIFRPGNLQIE